MNAQLMEELPKFRRLGEKFMIRYGTYYGQMIISGDRIFEPFFFPNKK